MNKTVRTLDLELLRTLQAVARVGSFTLAAPHLHRTQSAVSMQIKRLEELTGKRLLERDNQSVHLTAEGEKLLGFAARMLKLNDEAVTALHGRQIDGAVRLGLPADYAGSLLSSVLPFFAQAFPQVRIEVQCDLCPALLAAFDKGELDLVLVTREDATRDGGKAVWRERLCWVERRNELVHEARPLPLAFFPPDCSYRKVALMALEAQGTPYRIVYVSPSVAGIVAAVEAAFAVSVMAEGSLTPKMRQLGEAEGFPPLPSAEIIMYRAPGSDDGPVARVGDYILESLRAAPPRAVASGA